VSGAEDDLTILLVEDDPNLADLRGELFKRFGARVEVAHTADEAAAFIVSEAPVDLLITDIRLSDRPSDRGGLDVARLCKAERPLIPVIGYSAVVSEEELGSDSDQFSLMFPKALDGLGELEKRAEEIVDLARQARRARD
jgi:CheY-like chemotaxis protein